MFSLFHSSELVLHMNKQLGESDMKGMEWNEHNDIPTNLMRVCDALLNDQRA